MVGSFLLAVVFCGASVSLLLGQDVPTEGSLRDSPPPSAAVPREAESSADELLDLRQKIDRLADELGELRQEKSKEVPKPAGFTFKMNGQLAIDTLWFSQDAASRATVGDVQDVVDFRRARLTASGEYEDFFSYAIGFDFAQGSAQNGRPAFLDNYLGISGLPYAGNLRIGHFFEPFGLERSGTNRNLTFIERSLVDAFSPARNTGAMIFDQSADEAWWWAIGTFRGDSDNFGDDSGDQEGQTLDARVVWRPWYDEPSDGRYYLHLAGAYSFRDAADGLVRYRSRPEASGSEDPSSPATPFFVDTGPLAAEQAQLFGGELLWVHGPWMVQSEVAGSAVHLSSGEAVAFHGEYVFVGYFLTGEHQPYSRKFATVDRVKPLENFFRTRTEDGQIATGRGAWQVAARLSHLNLDAGSVAGGDETNFTLGLHWFLTPYHRMKFNYVQADLHRNQLASITHIFGMRFDVDF